MKRDPFLHWLLMMVTFGQYGLIWGFRLARDSNAMLGGRALDVRRHARVFMTGYVLLMLLFAGIDIWEWTAADISPSVELASDVLSLFGFILTAYFIWVLVKVAQMLRYISGKTSPRSCLVVFLYLLLGAALPLLQSHFNDNV